MTGELRRVGGGSRPGTGSSAEPAKERVISPARTAVLDSSVAQMIASASRMVRSPVGRNSTTARTSPGRSVRSARRDGGAEADAHQIVDASPGSAGTYCSAP
jgi:hypothetical protein